MNGTDDADSETATMEEPLLGIVHCANPYFTFSGIFDILSITMGKIMNMYKYQIQNLHGKMADKAS